MRAFAIPLCLLLAAAQQCGGDALAEYDAIVKEARRCAPGEACVIAGGAKGCRCPVAVRASAKESVDAAARRVVCPPNERLACPPLQTPQCASGTCAVDTAGE